MKKVCLATAGMLCLLTACNNPEKTTATGGDQSMAQKNLDAVHIVNKAFETGDVSHINEAVAPDFVDHTDMGDKTGPDSLKAMITMMHKGSSDMKMETIKEVADNDYVFEMMRYHGTSDGSMGMPKGAYDMHAVEVVRFKDGKGVEHWSFVNGGEMMKMMGGMPGGAPAGAPMPAKADTAKKM
jgi:predicted SnoaL-like aldol condensation-catalyzing enzyme